MTQPLHKNQILTGTVADLTSQGEGVVKIDHYPIFVPEALPEEEIRFKVIKVGKKFGFGKLLEILQPSPERVPIKDPSGHLVGTMTLQHLSYPGQLNYKCKLVKDVFQRIGGQPDAEVRPVLGMDNPWEYRNKAQIPVREIDGQLETGFFRRNSHDLIAVEHYYIQHPEIDQTIVTLRNILRELKIAPYNEVQHTGVVRHLIVKRGHYTEEMMVVIVTNTRELPQKNELVAKITEQLPQVVSIMQNIQSQRTNAIMGNETHLLWGQPYYTDQMLDLTFKISACSFYQVNTMQAERLYQEAIDAAQLTGTETVLDAYCGIGTITLALARHAKQVYGMEIVPEAIEMARENAQLNQLSNATFEAGSADHWIRQWQDEGLHFDVMVVDPPRKGLDADFIQTMIELSPDRIVYVSCNPATQARDVKLLCESGYQLKYVQPVDLFPQTVHVEAVALLTRNEATQ